MKTEETSGLSKVSGKSPTISTFSETGHIVSDIELNSAAPPLVSNSPFSAKKSSSLASATTPRTRARSSRRLGSPPKHLLGPSIDTSESSKTPKRVSARIKQLQSHSNVLRFSSFVERTPSTNKKYYEEPDETSSVRNTKIFSQNEKPSTIRRIKRGSSTNESVLPGRTRRATNQSDDSDSVSRSGKDDADESSEARQLRSSSRLKNPRPKSFQTADATPLRKTARTPRKARTLAPPSKLLQRQLGIEDEASPPNSDSEGGGRRVTRQMAKK